MTIIYLKADGIFLLSHGSYYALAYVNYTLWPHIYSVSFIRDLNYFYVAYCLLLVVQAYGVWNECINSNAVFYEMRDVCKSFQCIICSTEFLIILTL